MQLIRYLFSNFYPNMFRAHYAHNPENKTVYYRIWCSALVVWSWDANCVLCVKVDQRLSHSAHRSCSSSTQPQSAQSVQNTICSSTRSCVPDEGHNDARNMMREKFDNKYQTTCNSLVSLTSPSFLHISFWFLW